MKYEQALMQRADSKCELCTATSALAAHSIPESPQTNEDSHILLCETCREQISSEQLDLNHFRSLPDTMWSTVPAVQVMCYRLLKQLSSESWAQDALDMLYLEEDVKAWAEAGINDEVDDSEPCYDSNGVRLQAGDNVVLIKDLDVKGAGFTAKRGTAVRGISLTNNPEHIEGRVNGTRIVLVSKYLKKM
ncbi:PhnA domain-containing protein [Dasania sp. GY-MA-18]|uniref:PhnA domain-containing protein n=1 Tax=Dasania phycosphaerae TaxID=2950436 RepID=A0A9J6RRJ1_9GAMM|nr:MULTISPECIES: alkylphosphonate utilization protein [Dasania]MCR8924325.1 PhnA domain-containing protein [Dasania sp. GY-MA-18]MCZ0866978.1 PhnA domain-containing protein [Dasania phycosphaerae]MCZ0870482.1 PhnA domain-containing protein [Dasania phycosphaerae]